MELALIVGMGTRIREMGLRFTFTLNPINRPTTGSRSPNNAIIYRVEVQIPGVTTPIEFNLEQDETDIIRQEYIDFGVAPPARADIKAPPAPEYNVGNYSLIVNKGMENAFSAVEARFAQLTQAAATAAAAPGAAVPVPVPAISVTSGYRNPRRNVAVGSNFPVTSRHVWGKALDLVVTGANATLWARLRQAGIDCGYVSICENGPVKVECTDPNVDHVHIQW